MEMTNEVIDYFNVVYYEPDDWIGKFFFDDFSGTFYFQSTLTETERREIISQLLDRLGILTPPPDNIYVSIQGGVFIKHIGSGNSLLTRYRHIR